MLTRLLVEANSRFGLWDSPSPCEWNVAADWLEDHGAAIHLIESVRSGRMPRGIQVRVTASSGWQGMLDVSSLNDNHTVDWAWLESLLSQVSM